MAFLRFTRDKRGYEHFQLVQPATNRRGTTRPRILYWFRSPPNVKVGREPFDATVRIALEKKNPDVEFDWPEILATPIPAADAEHWRERRRQERAARQFLAEEEPADSVEIEADTGERRPDDRENANSSTEKGPRENRAVGREGDSDQEGDLARKTTRRKRRRSRRGRPDAVRPSTSDNAVAAITGPDTESDSESDSEPDV
jgi:hypothetical protein